MTEPVIELTGICRSFFGPVHAVVDADLEVRSGDFVAVMGRSGSGKSTLLNLIGLLDSPTAGRYRLFGHDVSSFDDRLRSSLRSRRIGFVFQQPHLIGTRSARENVEVGLRYAVVPRSDRAARIDQVLTAINLDHRVDARPTTLSGGEQQRVVIARALAGMPDLLLCDEPTGNLDRATAATVMKLVAGAAANGTTVMLVTHDPEVAGHADRIIVMDEGRIMSDD